MRIDELATMAMRAKEQGRGKPSTDGDFTMVYTCKEEVDLMMEEKDDERERWYRCSELWCGN